MIVIERKWRRWNDRINAHEDMHEYKVFDDNEKELIQDFINQYGDFEFHKL